MQHQRIDRVAQPGNGAAGQRGLGFGQGVYLLARVPGLARAEARGQAVERHVVAVALQARGVELGLVVGRQQAFGVAVARFHPVRLELGLHPGALLFAAGNAQAAHFAAQAGKGRRRTFAILEPGIPGFV
ncbi:hypothetical protein D3C78_1179630 [compost metagenome]